MATDNRRVAAYLPPEIDQKFKAFKIDRGLATEEKPNTNDSQALIQILSEFFEVSHLVSQEVDYSNKYATIEQLQELESKVEQISQLLQREVSQVKSELKSELLSDLPVFRENSHPGQLSLLASDKSKAESSKERITSDIPSELEDELPSESLLPEVFPMTGEALSLRIGRSKSAVKEAKRRYGSDSKKFIEWSRERDPDGVAWEYHIDTKKYHPVYSAMSKSQVNPLPEGSKRSGEG